MAGRWPKLLRDPVHNLIRFDDTALDRLLLKLIDCPEFQRLRRIKQLGFSELVFPGAVHSRFAHSIGVMWNTKRFLDRLAAASPGSADETHRSVVIVAALLHDLGHGPFSHAFEKITGERHEKRTAEIISVEDTEIHRCLAAYSDIPELAARVAALFSDESPAMSHTGENACPRHLQQVLSSQLDADRTDYLLRDGLCAGTEYGRFDLDWLMQHIIHDGARERLVLSSKARHAIEEYVFARYHMYQAVYFHKTTRAAEVMFKLLFRRFKTLLATCDDHARSGIVPECPTELLRVCEGNATLKDFLSLDDYGVSAFLKAATRCNDSTLCYLASGLLNRRLYKCVDATDASRDAPDRPGKFLVAMDRVLGQLGSALPVERETAFESDTPSDTPYRIYDPDDENPTTQIHIQLEMSEIQELSKRSEIVSALKRRISLLRYYFPAEIRNEVQIVANEHLKERVQ